MSTTSVVRAIARRPAALVRPYIPPALAPLPGPVRWSTTSAGRAVCDESSCRSVRHPQDDHPAYEQASEEKGKASERKVEKMELERARNRMQWIQSLLNESQKDIEGTDRWRELNARYPGLRRTQISLLAVLMEMVQVANKQKQRLTARELFQAHLFLLQPRDDPGEGQKGEGSKGLRFERSSATFTVLLKYAYKLRDARSLRSMGKQAISWKHRHGGKKPVEARARFLHPRLAAADDINRLARNLFLSLAVRYKQTVSRKGERFMRGKELPSSGEQILWGDDAIAVSALLRTRTGVVKRARREGESGETYFKLSRSAQLARYPLTHQSRRVRWINRQLERGLLPDVVASDASELTMAPNTVSEEEGRREGGAEGKEAMDLFKGAVKGTSQSDVAMLEGVRQRFQDQLATRLRHKRSIARALKQFRFKREVGEEGKLVTQSQVVPTWLLLSVLRTHIDAGDPKKAERMAELYLGSLQKGHPDQSLRKVIPINHNRIHAITDPLSPPNGASILNGILRAHETSGASDCFEAMIEAVERWSVEGKGLCTSIHHRPTPVPVPDCGACLVPNQTTLLLLLHALRSRRKRLALGIKTVEEVWTRWSHTALVKKRKEEESHHVLSLPLRAFITLLKWAVQEKKGDKVDRVLAMETDWRQRGLQHESWVGERPEEKIAWSRAVKKASEARVMWG